MKGANEAEREPTVPLHVLTAALDEIYALRKALAYEASGLEATLDYKSFPKSRRAISEGQIERMRGAARGEVQRQYAGQSFLSLRHALTRAGAPETLTRHVWERQTFPKRSVSPLRKEAS